MTLSHLKYCLKTFNTLTHGIFMLYFTYCTTLKFLCTVFDWRPLIMKRTIFTLSSLFFVLFINASGYKIKGIFELIRVYEYHFEQACQNGYPETTVEDMVEQVLTVPGYLVDDESLRGAEWTLR